MKNLFVFFLIFGLGALTFFIADRFLRPAEETLLTTQQEATSTPVVTEEEIASSSTQTDTSEPVVMSEDGSQLDGPFPLMTKKGEKTGATVRIIRSPEENLIQFEGFTETHSPDDDIYFASDLDATSHITLGYAKLNSGVTVYGIPLDADLDTYPYILIYDVRTKTTEYYAQIK